MIYISKEDLIKGGNFIMLCGAPGSGKSEYANKLIREFIETEHEFDIASWAIIAPEKIREELTGAKNNQSRNKEVFDLVHSDIRHALEDGMNVIYDATNTNPKSRRKIMNTVSHSDHDGVSVCLIFKTSLIDCLRKNDERDEDRRVPEEVIERMYTKLKVNPPALFEGFDVIAYV